MKGLTNVDAPPDRQQPGASRIAAAAGLVRGEIAFRLLTRRMTPLRPDATPVAASTVRSVSDEAMNYAVRRWLRFGRNEFLGGWRRVLGVCVPRSLRVFLAVVSLLPVGAIGASSAGAAGGTTCSSLHGIAALTPGLPKIGDTTLVRSRVSIKGARLSGCRGSVTNATVRATLRFAKPSNCTLLISQVTAATTVVAKGTATFTWNNRRTSTVSLSVSLGAIPDQPSVAKIAGTVTAGLFKGMKESGTVIWSLDSTACFGGAPLKSLTFTQFSPFVVK